MRPSCAYLEALKELVACLPEALAGHLDGKQPSSKARALDDAPPVPMSSRSTDAS